MLEKIKKGLTISSIVSLVVAVGFLIGAIFGLNIAKNPVFSIMITFAILCIACVLAINSLTLIEEKQVMSIIDLSFICALTLLSIILLWKQVEITNIAFKIDIILALFTVLFNIVVSYKLKLGKNLIVLQIITYVFVIAIDVLITIIILGIDLFKINWFSKLFWVICLVAFIMLVTISILSKKYNVNRGITKINSKSGEIEALKERIRQLEKENAELRERLK